MAAAALRVSEDPAGPGAAEEARAGGATLPGGGGGGPALTLRFSPRSA